MITNPADLVRHVEEGQGALSLEHLADGVPLLGRGVHTRGVVGAGVQQHQGTRGQVLVKGGLCWCSVQC